MRQNAAFCPQCGEISAATAAHLAPEPERGNPRRIMLIFAIVLSLAVAGYLGVTYAKRTGLFASHELYQIEPLMTGPGEKARPFLARHDRGISPSEMLESARKQCRKATEGSPKSVCVILITPWDSGLEKPLDTFTPESFQQYAARRWITDDPTLLTALYIYDARDSLGGSRNDGMLALDCAKTALQPGDQAKAIVCKNSDNDEISTGLSRALGEADASEDAMAEPAEEAVATEAAAAMPPPPVVAGYGTFHVVADANRRSMATASSANTGRVSRGTALQGAMVTGEDGTSNWLQLADGSGFISSVNISNSPPPRLATMLGERRFRPGFDLQLFAAPSDRSAVIDTVPAGTVLVLTGITDNGFAEAKGRSGGVGYFLAEGYDFSR